MTKNVHSIRIGAVGLGALLCALSAIASPSLVGAQPAADTQPFSEPVEPEVDDLTGIPLGFEGVAISEHLDSRIPTDLVFRDHTGQRVTLGEYFDGERPILLNLVYHSCPSFCSLVLDGTLQVLKEQEWTVGDEFDVVTVSIDPRDTPEIAAEKRDEILANYGRDARDGWHFLVAEENLTERELTAAYGRTATIDRLVDAVGFSYQWMPRERQYAHPGAILLMTPNARIARYLYGLEYRVGDVRLGLLEASEGRSISTVERIAIYCYRYDPNAQGYTLVAWRVMQVAGVFCALLLLAFVLFWWRNDAGRRRGAATPSSDHESTDNTPPREITRA